jgi:hypothetical protein
MARNQSSHNDLLRGGLSWASGACRGRGSEATRASRRVFLNRCIVEVKRCFLAFLKSLDILDATSPGTAHPLVICDVHGANFCQLICGETVHQVVFGGFQIGGFHIDGNGISRGRRFMPTGKWAHADVARRTEEQCPTHSPTTDGHFHGRRVFMPSGLLLDWPSAHDLYATCLAVHVRVGLLRRFCELTVLDARLYVRVRRIDEPA